MMDIHWRNTQKPARFLIFDARSFAAVLFFLAHARQWTFVTVVTVMIIFYLFERRGLSFDSALRSFRCWILGSNRPSNNGRVWRWWIDYG